MLRNFLQPSSRLSRRAAVAGVAITSGTLGLDHLHRAAAQEATSDDLAGHPLVGTWAVMTPGGVVPQTFNAWCELSCGPQKKTAQPRGNCPRHPARTAIQALPGRTKIRTIAWVLVIHTTRFSPDGSHIAAFPPNYVDPMLGLTFQGPGLGRWEAFDARTGHFTLIQALSDADGAYAGTFQFEAHPEVSADGRTFIHDRPQRVIVRDAANTVIFDQVLPMDLPVTATRVGATMESVVLPVTASVEATPTS